MPLQPVRLSRAMGVSGDDRCYARFAVDTSTAATTRDTRDALPTRPGGRRCGSERSTGGGCGHAPVAANPLRDGARAVDPPGRDTAGGRPVRAVDIRCQPHRIVSGTCDAALRNHRAEGACGGPSCLQSALCVSVQLVLRGAGPRSPAPAARHAQAPVIRRGAAPSGTSTPRWRAFSSEPISPCWHRPSR